MVAQRANPCLNQPAIQLIYKWTDGQITPKLRGAQGEKRKTKLPFNRKKPQAEPDSERTAICLHLMRVERLSFICT